MVHAARSDSSGSADEEPGVKELHALDDDAVRELERRLVRKLDMRMMPALVLMYFLAALNRGGFASARLQGFQVDLDLTDSEFATTLALFFVGYVVFQIPSNLFLERCARPSRWLPGAMFLWGMITALGGTITDYAGALAVRVSLGIAQSAFFPGALFLQSCWYIEAEGRCPRAASV